MSTNTSTKYPKVIGFISLLYLVNKCFDKKKPKSLDIVLFGGLKNFYDNLKEREQSYQTRTLALKQGSDIAICDVTLTYVMRGDN